MPGLRMIFSFPNFIRLRPVSSPPQLSYSPKMAVTSSSISLSAPYTLFTLSQPIRQTRAKDCEGSTYRTCYTSPVDRRKRRRTGSAEIVVAIDGDGVNIYDVRSTQLVSTHALPPATKFSCAPVSSATRISKSKLMRRTYAAISFPKRQIVCWEEYDIHSGQGSNAESTSIAPLYRNNDYGHEVVHLYDLSKNGSTGLLAAYKDGCIRCFSADLKEELWEFQPSDPRTAGTPEKIFTSLEVVYAVSADLSIVRKTLLRSRPDVITPGDINGDAQVSRDIVLFTVIRAGDYFQTRLFLIPMIQAGGKGASELLTSELSAVEGNWHSIFSLHLSSATLYQLSATHLTEFSLAQTTPTVISSLRLPAGSNETFQMSSLLRVTSSTVLVTTHKDISLYDTRFSSLQARASLYSDPMPSAAASGDPFRASTPVSVPDGKPSGQIFLTSYIQELDLAVGYSQAGIIGVQLTCTGGGAGTKADVRRSGLLIDSLCRGVDGIDDMAGKRELPRVLGSKDILLKLASDRNSVKEAIRDLKEAKEASDLDKFEGAFAKYVGVSRKTEKTEGDGDTPMANGTFNSENAAKLINEGEPLPEFRFKHRGRASQSSYKPLRHEFVVAVLDMIFETLSDEDSVQKLSVSFYPPNVFRYLIESGNFSETLLGSGGGLLQCLAEFDPSLRTLEWVFGAVGEIGPGEVIKAIEIGLRHESVDINGEDQIVLDAIRNEVMRLALVRLNNFPAEVIIKALKTGLKGQDLMGLIQLLRKELLVGRQLHDEVGVGIGIEDVGIVSDLLTVALDTVGIGGLVLGDSSDGLIQELRGEVEAAVGTVEEASRLKCMLEEMFRHGDWRRVAIEKRVSKRGTGKRRKQRRINSASEKEKRGEEKHGKDEELEMSGLQNGQLEKMELETGGGEWGKGEGAKDHKKQQKQVLEPVLASAAELSHGAFSENPMDELPAPPAEVSTKIPADGSVDESAEASVRLGRSSKKTKRQNRIARTEDNGMRKMPAKSVSLARHLVNSSPTRNATTSLVSPLLPLGIPPPLVSRISLVTQPGEDEVDFRELRELNRRKYKEASYRESIVAGVYSVESMLV